MCIRDSRHRPRRCPPRRPGLAPNCTLSAQNRTKVHSFCPKSCQSVLFLPIDIPECTVSADSHTIRALSATTLVVAQCVVQVSPRSALFLPKAMPSVHSLCLKSYQQCTLSAQSHTRVYSLCRKS
eukprot:2221824-Rhodomonas_salina.1